MAVTTPLSQPIVTLTRVTESFDCDADSLSQFSQRGVDVEAYTDCRASVHEHSRGTVGE